MNFRTSYTDAFDNSVTDRKMIARSYLTHWFIIDVVSVMPFQEIMTSDSLGFVRLIKGARVGLPTSNADCVALMCHCSLFLETLCSQLFV
jgi:hypothetical protein